MLAPVNHVIGLTTIVRERLLPVAGEVTARLNQKVSPVDVVAEANWAREHVLVDVARTLGIAPEQADRLIKCKIGEQIPQGAEIAVGKGIVPRRIHAPREGRVVALGGGQVLMETGETKYELPAGIPGIVVEIVPKRGVVIQTAGALIQGVWGNGRIDTGLLVNLTQTPDHVLDSSQLDISLRGSIILGGMVKDEETLETAAQLPVRGLILSSMPSDFIPQAREMRYALMLTDGFGALPMNSAAHRLLSTNAKREVTLNAERRNRYSGACPEVIIPLPVSSNPPAPREAETFAPGLQVRMRRPPHMGMIGVIAEIKPGLTVLPSGLRAAAAEVKLENNETVIAPLVNLEVVG